MPMKQSEKVCKTCLFYSGEVGECRYTHVFEDTREDDWCGDGAWKSMSKITGRMEEYTLCDSELSYEEERSVERMDRGNKFYVVTLSDIHNEGARCEIFKQEYAAKTYISEELRIDKNETLKIRLYESYWVDSDECYETTEVLVSRVC